MEDGDFFLFSFFLNGDESFVDFVVDLDWSVNGEVFFLDLFFEVVPLGPDALMELLCFFEDGELEHIEGLAVLNDEFEVGIDLFGMRVLALLEFAHDGVEIHGVFDFFVVACD